MRRASDEHDQMRKQVRHQEEDPMRGALKIIALVAVLALVAASCGGGDEAGETPAPPAGEEPV